MELQEKAAQLLGQAAVFREERLWCHEVAGLLKTNEAGLRKLADWYIARNDGSQQYLTLQNATSLFCVDSGLAIRERDLIFMYAHSKITNVEEQSDNSPYRYHRLRFVEFLELLGRVAEFSFAGSELRSLELTQKI